MSVDRPAEVVTAMGGAPPTDEQWRAITWPLEPSVLIAGAGSGKTSVIAARVVYLALAALGRSTATRRRAARQRAVPHVHGEGDRQPALAHPPRARRASTSPRARSRDPELPRVRRPGDRSLRHPRRHRDRPRVLSQAQRVTLAGRVLDEMTFEHVKTEWQPSVVDKILNLDGQIANHLVDPDEVVAFVEARLPVFKEIARTDRVY